MILYYLYNYKYLFKIICIYILYLNNLRSKQIVNNSFRKFKYKIKYEEN